MRATIVALFGSRLTMWAFYVILAACVALSYYGLLRKVNGQGVLIAQYERETAAAVVHTKDTALNTKEATNARERTREVLAANPDLRDHPLPDDVADRLRQRDDRKH